MKFFMDLGVKKKLIVLFSVVCIFIILIGAQGISSSSKISKGAKDIYSNNLVSVRDLEGIKGNLNDIGVNMLRMILERDKSELDDQIKNINDLTNKDIIWQKEYSSLPSTPEEQKTYDGFKNDLVKYRETRTKVIELVKVNNYEGAVKLYNLDMETIKTSMYEKLIKCIEINEKSAQQANSDNIAQFDKARNTIIIYTTISFLFILFIAYILSKNIMYPLNKIKELAGRLSRYDFSEKITIKRKDEFGQTGNALNTAQENISILVKTIMENAQDMSASSEELSATVQELSSKAEIIDEAVNTIAAGIQESSAASEEISASVEEVDSSINVLSSNAMEGSDASNQSKEKAAKAQNDSKNAIEGTLIISAEKQKKMEKAIEDAKVIDTIKVMADTISSLAGQTNLLALNAAIEAARAGEQGRGFAVVADEVRNLAEQSAEAVINIQDTIVKVQQAFKSSVDTSIDMLKFLNTEVHEQFNSYGEIGNTYYNAADETNKMTEEFASMSEEITATIGQVSQAVQNMAQASQKSSEQSNTIKENIDQTTKAIEQVAVTAQSQSEIAQKLNAIIQKFKI